MPRSRGSSAARGRRRRSRPGRAPRSRRSGSCTPRSSSNEPSDVVSTVPSSVGAEARPRSASTNEAGQRCWWRSTAVTRASPPAATSSTSGSRSGSGSPAPTNGATLTDDRVRSRGAGRQRAPHGDRTPGSRGEARSRARALPSATCSASRRAASGAIVVRSSIASACVVDTSSSDTGCASSRASAAIAWTAIPSSLSALSASPGCSPSPSGRPVSGAWRSFTDRSAALVRTCATTRRARSSAVASGGDVEVADGDEPVLVDHHERVRLVRVELALDLLDDEAERVASRSVELRDGAEAERVLERARARPRCPRAAREAGRASPRRPGDGRTDASAGWSSASRFAPSASRSSAPATSRVASSSRASWNASAAWPVENAFWLSSAMPSPGAGASSPRRPTARSAICARSPARSSRATAPAAGRRRSARGRRARRARDGRPRAPARERSRGAAPRRARRRAGAPAPGRSGAGGAAAPRDRRR